MTMVVPFRADLKYDEGDKRVEFIKGGRKYFPKKIKVCWKGARFGFRFQH